MDRVYTYVLMRPGDTTEEDSVFPAQACWGKPAEAAGAAEAELLGTFGSDGDDSALLSLIREMRRHAPAALREGKEYTCDAPDIFRLTLYGMVVKGSS